ncbi:MAG: (d)CMP kinase [Deltaproteobacteria bacterium]|nr:(d)CMP kinase [Deltaproteobacteria bacterium]
MRERPVIAIDGPSGAGKTTVSKRLAERTGLLRLDTGAMYRACALAARRAGIPWSDAGALGPFCARLDLRFEGTGEAMRTLLSGEDMSDAIRTPEMSMGASDVSRHAGVREAMVALQRRMAGKGGVIAEGRDTTTVVFPDADVKYFLDAVAAVRASRRYLEWGPEKGLSFEEVLADVIRRDVQDSTRDHSPLRVAKGAIYLDTTTRTVDEVIGEMLRSLPAEVRGRLPGGAGAGSPGMGKQ